MNYNSVITIKKNILISSRLKYPLFKSEGNFNNELLY